MRILSLRLANFRGVAEREITLPHNGVVVIEGPNEIGKSSMAEAFDLLLSELDSSKKKKVTAIKPVHLDEGPEVEAEIETGQYRFRYRKRFLKRPETVLTVTAPRAESHTGRTAHERVNQILDETMDRALFQALRVQQDDPFAAPDLGSAQSLAAALNRSAGQEVAGDRESTLLERVQTESLRYLTATGRPGQLLRDASTATEDAEQALSGMRERLQALQSDIDSVEGLERRLAELEKAMLEQQVTARTRRAEVEGLKEREVALANLQVESRSATLSETAAREAVEKRRALIEEAEKLDRRLKECEEDLAGGQPELDEAEKEAKAAADVRRAADEIAQHARAVSELRGKDKEFQHYQRDLEQMQARRHAISEAVKGRAAAQAVLDAARIDETLLEELEKVHMSLQRCAAQAQTRGAQLRIEAQRDLALRLDDEEVELASGETHDQVVSRRLSLELPGQMKIEFQGGAGSDELQMAVAAARESFVELIARAGVESIGDARSALQRRVDADRVRRDCDDRITEKLEDQPSLDALVEKIENSQAIAVSILKERPDEPPMPPDFGAAQEAHRIAREQADDAERAVEPARTRDDAARARFASLDEKTANTRVAIQVARGSAETKAKELENARAEHTDEVLDSAFGKLRDKAEAARGVFEEASRELEKIQPATMRELADNAERAAERAGRECEETRGKLRDTRTQISVRGGEGLFESEQEADILVERCRRHKESLEARAGAARLLFETMRDAETDARRNYAAPLRGKIVELGRLVFDDTFNVELDESLAVHERTLNGRTVPFDSLSVGAREQIGLITRLACALLVDPKDGVPVILDDTLGSADPQRLEGLGAMLNVAGRQAQIIVLTCTPGRFRHIGDATVIRF